MANKRSPKKRRPVPKTVLRLPDRDQAKEAVLNSLSSRDTQRGYRHAMDEFIEWYCTEPRLSFSRTVVVRYRMHLESRKPRTRNRESTVSCAVSTRAVVKESVIERTSKTFAEVFFLVRAYTTIRQEL
jgi:hypothetical protein